VELDTFLPLLEAHNVHHARLVILRPPTLRPVVLYVLQARTVTEKLRIAVYVQWEPILQQGSTTARSVHLVQL